MNIQQMQDTLTYLMLVITAFYALAILFDFVCGLVHLWHQVALNTESSLTSDLSEDLAAKSLEITSLHQIEHKYDTRLNDNHAHENYHTKITNNNFHSSPYLNSLQPELELNDSVTIDINKIDLRTARKIASAIRKAVKPKSDLIIKQKVNGKSVPLAWLQAQIKNRLEIAPEIVQLIIQELAPTAFHNSQQDIQHYQVGQQSKRKFQVG